MVAMTAANSPTPAATEATSMTMTTIVVATAQAQTRAVNSQPGAVTIGRSIHQLSSAIGTPTTIPAARPSRTDDAAGSVITWNAWRMQIHTIVEHNSCASMRPRRALIAATGRV